MNSPQSFSRSNNGFVRLIVIVAILWGSADHCIKAESESTSTSNKTRSASSHCGADVQPASLVLRNGKIVTVDKKQPEVEAIAIHGNRISAIGTDAEIKKFIGPKTRVIDLHGKLAVPGFIEGHAHFLSLGQSKLNLDLTRVRSWSEIVELVAQAAKEAEPGEWIVGRGWHQEKWDKPPTNNVDGYPVHAELSKVSPANPVLLTHASGHMSVANERAMQLANIDNETQDPNGGEILRDKKNWPTGVFRESAQSLVDRSYARARSSRTRKQRETEISKALELATQECLSTGITSFQDAGSSFGTIDRYKLLADQHKLQLRLWVMVNEGNSSLRRRLADYRLIGYGDGFLTVRAIKRMADGALGSHGAWLLKPYADMPNSTGLNLGSLESIKETAKIAIKNDFQVCTHAIGDRANREVLDIYQTVFRTYSNKRDLRWRIEHAQHIHPDDIVRFAELGVIASMQANHCTSDGPFVVTRLGHDRAKYGAYVWQSLIKAGVVVTNGTDAPVEHVDPIGSFYAAVSRKLKDGSVFFPEQRMSRLQALQSYTINAAHAAFEESIKGSLTPGKLADVAILSHDIMTMPENDIRNTSVLYTIVGGKVAFERRTN